MEKAREHHIDLYMCFIDYKKVFDCVDHERLWVILRDMGVPVHLIVLVRRLYTNHEATVRTEFGETDNIDIGNATGMYPLTTAFQYICRKHNEGGFGKMGEGNQHRREDGNEPETR